MGFAVGLQRLIGGGPPPASLAFLVAMDRGYDLDTVASAVAERRFDVDGVVFGADGEVVRPTGADTGVIVDKAPLDATSRSLGFRMTAPVGSETGGVTVAGLGAALWDDVATVDIGDGPGVPPDGERLPPALADQERAVVMSALQLFQMTLLVRAGFTVEQIVTSVVLGTLPQCTEYTETDVSGATLYWQDCTLDGAKPGETADVAPTADDESDATVDDDAGTTDESSAVPDSVSFAGGAVGAPGEPNTVRGDVEAESVVFSATVADGVVEMTVWVNYWGWMRGGPEDPPHEDQNCGARLVETLRGSAPAGEATTIELLVETSELSDFTGALCQEGDGDFRVGAPGDRRDTFTGKADHTGIDGSLSAIELAVRSADG
jgi:hypothetical protein